MKIAIAGYGIEGRANYDYWSRLHPNAQITIVDEGAYDEGSFPAGVETILGEGAFQQLEGFDLVIRTAGLAPYKIKTDGKIWSATNEFFEKCPALIIGITGSKGKGTTASLIHSILEASDKKSWLVGNIGTPALEVLSQITADDIVVYELSSFQLWDLERSPQIGVVTIIEPDHLDVHTGFDDYIAAKSHISLHQTADDITYYYPYNEYSQAIAEAGYWFAEADPDRTEDLGELEERAVPYISEEGVHVEDGAFYDGQRRLCSVDALQLVGKHFQDNACAAISAALEIEGVTAQSIEAGLRAFHGLPHRLKLVATVHDVSYYDDSIATTPGSAIAALRAFTQPKVLILGGSFKGSDFSELAKEVIQHDVDVLLIGAEADRIATALDEVRFSHYERIDDPTMENIVRRAADIAKPGSVVLLSPAAASFGLFKNYADRGDQFIAAVEAL